MSLTEICPCEKPRPAIDERADALICQTCGGLVRAEKSVESASNGATIDAEQKARRTKLEAIERQLHYLIGQVRELKNT